jgi:Protein of unknown function (DUF3306)
MSDQESFLARWSRRKQAQDAERDAKQGVETIKPSAEASRDVGEARHASDGAPANPASEKPPFDIASLPSIDSITAESDIRAFLAPGVPPDLTRAALRRAWSADPQIRNFVGLADYDWDFNTPGAISGFGALEMSDALRDELARMVGRSLATGPDTAATSLPGEQFQVELSGESADAPASPVQENPVALEDHGMKSDDDPHNSSPVPQREKEIIATQNRTAAIDNGKLIVKRAHGRALPK